MKIVATTRTRNEADNIERFVMSYQWADKILIADGGSIDNTHKILKHFSQHLPLKVIVDKTRNFGYLRNLGTQHSKGQILIHCNTDNYLPPNFLKKIDKEYKNDFWLLSLSGRVFPMGTSIIAHIAYQLFDLLRFLFTCAPMPIKKYRPSGSFMTVRRWVHQEVNGYPEVAVNEDGLYGGRIEQFIKTHGLPHKSVAFKLNMHVGHHVKKFEDWGGVKAFLFYLYTLTNFFPLLKPLLAPIEQNAKHIFQHDPLPSITLKQWIYKFLDWL